MVKVFRSLYFNFIKILSQIIYFFGYELDISISRKLPSNSKNELNLNIGAGSYEIHNFKSLDIYSEHYYPSKKSFLKNRINYDIRKNSIPFKDNSIDNIYVSHVIEHIEDKYVNQFITDALRVLKPGGILRIVCPDGKFLFKISQFKNQYWTWRHRLFNDKQQYDTDWNIIESYDFLMRELSTPKCRYYKNKISDNYYELEKLKKLKYEDFISVVKKGLSFRTAFPGDHISIWDFDMLNKIGIEAGFSHIIESKQYGSVSLTMQSRNLDKVGPQMSLYVDMIK